MFENDGLNVGFDPNLLAQMYANRGNTMGGAAFNQYMGQQAASGPMFGRVREPMMRPLIDLSPFGVSPAISGMLSMVMPAYMRDMLSVPMQMFPQQNVFDQMRDRMYWADRSHALNIGMQADTQSFMRTARSMYESATGTPMSYGMQQSMQRLSGGAAQALPILRGIFGPRADALIEGLAGPGGSHYLAMEAIHRGGRMLVDPVTGMSGLTVDSVAAYSNAFTRQFSASGATGWHGIGAGRAGQMFEEMAARGLTRPSLFAGRSRAEQIRTPGVLREVISSMSDEDVVEFGRARFGGDGTAKDYRARLHAAAADPTTSSRLADDLDSKTPTSFSSAIRNIDSRRIVEGTKGMAQMVTAMRDIFGDVGDTSAPMSKIFAGLEALTQGGVRQMSPDRIARLVYQLRETARSTGIGIDALMGQIGAMAPMADHMGVPRGSLPGIAANAAQFGKVYKDQFAGAGGLGRLSPEEMSGIQSQLAIQAAASPVGNATAAIVRAVKTGLVTKGPMLEYANALISGQTALADGRSAAVTGEQFINLALKSGLSHEVATSLLGERATNMQFGQEFSAVGAAARESQFDLDMRRILPSAFGGALAATLGRGAEGFNRTDRGRRSMHKMSTAMMDAIFSLRPEQFADSQQRNEAIANYLKQHGGDLTRRMDHKHLLQFAELSWGSLESVAIGRNFGSALGLVDALHPSLTRGAAAGRSQDAASAEIASRLSDVGRQPLVQRAIGMFNENPKTASEAMGRLLGSVNIEDIRRAVGIGDASTVSDKQAFSAQMLGISRFIEMNAADMSHLNPSARNKARLDIAEGISAVTEGGARADRRLREMLKKYRMTVDDFRKNRYDGRLDRMTAAERDIANALLVSGTGGKGGASSTAKKAAPEITLDRYMEGIPDEENLSAMNGSEKGREEVAAMIGNVIDATADSPDKIAGLAGSDQELIAGFLRRRREASELGIGYEEYAKRIGYDTSKDASILTGMKNRHLRGDRGSKEGLQDKLKDELTRKPTKAQIRDAIAAEAKRSGVELSDKELDSMADTAISSGNAGEGYMKLRSLGSMSDAQRTDARKAVKSAVASGQDVAGTAGGIQAVGAGPLISYGDYKDGGAGTGKDKFKSGVSAYFDKDKDATQIASAYETPDQTKKREQKIADDKKPKQSMDVTGTLKLIDDKGRLIAQAAFQDSHGTVPAAV